MEVGWRKPRAKRLVTTRASVGFVIWHTDNLTHVIFFYRETVTRLVYRIGDGITHELGDRLQKVGRDEREKKLSSFSTAHIQVICPRRSQQRVTLDNSGKARKCVWLSRGTEISRHGLLTHTRVRKYVCNKSGEVSFYDPIVIDVARNGDARLSLRKRLAKREDRGSLD